MIKLFALVLASFFHIQLAAAQVGFSLPAASDGGFVCNVSFGGKPSSNPYGIIIGSVNGQGRQLTATDRSYFTASDQWSSQISMLNIGLTTELMGAGYAIHVCYQGPLERKVQIGNCKKDDTDKKKDQPPSDEPEEDIPCFKNENELAGALGEQVDLGDAEQNGKKSKKVDLSEKIYTAVTSVSGSNFFYGNLANLHYKTTIKCDLRKIGAQTRPRGKTEARPSGNMEVDFSYSTNWAPISNTLASASTIINSSKSNVPRFCEVIYDFKEMSGAERPNFMRDTEYTLGLDIY